MKHPGYIPLVSQRVDAIVLSVAFICGVISVFVGFYGRYFVDFCIGGIISMPVGVIIGVAVSWRCDGHDVKILLRGIFGFLLALVLNCFAFSGFILPLIDAKTNTERIKNLKEGDVEKIVFYDDFGNQTIGIIADDDMLNSFVELSKDIQVDQPRSSHVSSEESWQVKIIFVDGTSVRMRWVHIANYKRSVFGQFLDGGSRLAIYHGPYYSKGLRKWFVENVKPLLPDDEQR